MGKIAIHALLLSGALALPGCVGVSMHSLHPTQVMVTDAGSNQPAAHVPLAVEYDYDSYGMFKMFNVPSPESAETDADGAAVMNLADFRYRILLKVGGNFCREDVDKKAVLKGAVLSAPPYKVVLAPLRPATH